MSASMIRADERAMKLMAFADGELEGDELAEVERWLEEDAEAVLFANDLAELGDLVKVGHASKDFDIADQVMAQIEVEDEKPGAKVVALRPRAVVPASNKRRTAAWVVAGLALAASVFLVTRAKHEDEAPLARTTSPLVQPTENVAAAAVAPGSVNVENPGASVRVIYVPDETLPNVTTVVWVDEPGGK